MKAFLQEYGFSILAAIVVILLIMMISPVGVNIKESLKSVVTNFSTTTENGIDNVNVFDDILQEEKLPVYLLDTGDGPAAYIKKTNGNYDAFLLTDAGDGKYYVVDSASDIEGSDIDSYIEEHPEIVVTDSFDLSLIVEKPEIEEIKLYNLYKVEDRDNGTLYLLVTRFTSQTRYLMEPYVMFNGELVRAHANRCRREFYLSDYPEYEKLDYHDYSFSTKLYYAGSTNSVTLYKAKETFESRGGFAHGDTFTEGTVYILEPINDNVYTTYNVYNQYVNLPYSGKANMGYLYAEDLDKFEQITVQWPDYVCFAN